MRSFPLALVLALGACGAPADDDTDTDTDAAETDDTDAAETDDTDTVDTDDTDAAETDDTDATSETDAADTGDSGPVGPRDLTAPTLPNTSGSDYTLFWDGDSLNIYWRPASDDTTAADALEYQVWCQHAGSLSGFDVVMAWTVATSIPVEASSRYWIEACTAAGGTGPASAFVSVRDESGNSTDYPILGGSIPGPK